MRVFIVAAALLLLLLPLLSCAHLGQAIDEWCATPAGARAAEDLTPRAREALLRPNWGGALDALLGASGKGIICAVRRLSVLGDPERVSAPMSAAAGADPVPGRAQEWLRSRGYEVKR